jgi:DNA-binding NarL/FixJ family response regulator
MNVHSPRVEVEDAAASLERHLVLAPPVDAPADVAEGGLRLLVVHDHEVVRSGFRLMLGRLPWVDRCLGASNVEEAQSLWDRYDPHVALVDLSVDGTWGTDLCWKLRRARPGGRVLLMSATERISPSASRAAGAAGFIGTGSSTEQIAHAVRMAWHGRAVGQVGPAPAGRLSGRQRDVLRLMAAGATNREIATKLGLSPHTVKGHTSGLYRRLSVRNRAQAVRRAERVGLLA